MSTLKQKINKIHNSGMTPEEMTDAVISVTIESLDNIYKFSNDDDRLNFYIDIFGTDTGDLDKIDWEFTRQDK